MCSDLPVQNAPTHGDSQGGAHQRGAPYQPYAVAQRHAQRSQISPEAATGPPCS